MDFGAKDGPADLAFLIAAPAGGDATHLQLLTKLARSLVKPSFTNALREAEDADEVVALINQALDVPDPASAAAKPAAASGTPDGTPPGVRPARPPLPRCGRHRHRAGPTSLVAVTACPTGIAHTYMAAEALEAAAARAGVAHPGRDPGSAGRRPCRTRRSPGRRGDLRRRRRACATAAASPASRWSAPV